jgi:hypothetical protein
MTRAIALIAVTALVLSQAACGEKEQTAATRKPDTKVWSGTDNAFAATGWKAGDQASWEEQMRSRAQEQNEYTRAK